MTVKPIIGQGHIPHTVMQLGKLQKELLPTALDTKCANVQHMALP